MSDNGQYAVKASNSEGEAVCVANVVVEKEVSPPPRPPEPQYESEPEARSDTPLSRSSTCGRELGPETQALKVLSTYKRRSKPLPDLLPFPFKPDEVVERPRKNNTKVPKPSRFIAGEMYHSDYESDFEGNIGVKWRSAVSDTEDTDPRYKKVRPVLTQGFSRKSKERNPSPPCPHQWESHEDIDKLENQLKTKRRLVNVVRQYDRKEEILTTEETSTSTRIVADGEEEKVEKETNGDGESVPEYYEAFAVVKSHSNISIKIDQTSSSADSVPPPLPAKNKLNVLTPSASMRSVDSGSFSDETSFTVSSLSSQSTVQTVRTSNYIKVREKVQQLERKVEEDFLRQALDEDSGSIRPERIPGAVRVLPTPTPPGSRPESRSSSRKSSVTRSNSTDFTSSLSRSVQPSPLFGRKYQDAPPPMFVPPTLPDGGWRSVSCSLERGPVRETGQKEPTPPSKFERPEVVSGKLRPEIDLERTVEEIKKYRNQTSASVLRVESDQLRGESSSSHHHLTSPPPLETVSNCYQESSRFIMMQRRSRSRDILSEDESDTRMERLKSPALVLEADKSAKRPSLDGYEADTDTLKSGKGSVRNIASMFEKREVTNPSPVPRPVSVQSLRFKTPEPGSFTSSTAYVAPKWASQESTVKSETKMIRINQSLVNSFQSTETDTNSCQSSENGKFQSMFSCSAPQPQPEPSPNIERPSNPSPCIFQPRKFVAGKCDDDTFTQHQEAGHLPAVWLPESVSDLCRSQPEYRSVQPSLSRTVTPNNV